MLRKHLPKLIGIVIVVLLCLIFLIPDLALRTAVFWRSPVKAFTMEYEEDVEYEKRDGFDENTKLYRITNEVLCQCHVFPPPASDTRRHTDSDCSRGSGTCHRA